MTKDCFLAISLVLLSAPLAASGSAGDDSEPRDPFRPGVLRVEPRGTEGLAVRGVVRGMNGGHAVLENDAGHAVIVRPGMPLGPRHTVASIDGDGVWIEERWVDRRGEPKTSMVHLSLRVEKPQAAPPPFIEN